MVSKRKQRKKAKEKVGVEEIKAQLERKFEKELNRGKEKLTEEEKRVREYIVNNPFKAVAIAFLLGYLLGRAK